MGQPDFREGRPGGHTHVHVMLGHVYMTSMCTTSVMLLMMLVNTTMMMMMTVIKVPGSLAIANSMK